MSVRVVFSYRGKPGSLKEAVGTIVQARSKKLIVAYKDIVEKKLARVSKVWQAWLRQRLSVQSDPHKLNRTKWPKKRTGRLRDSIREPKLSVSRYTGPATYAPSYKFKLKGLFGVRPSATLSDVGQYLNDWQDKSFAGWKLRAQRNLYERMMSEIRSTKIGK